MNDDNERSVASDGSVLCVWGWVQTDWDGTEFVIPCGDQCEATHRASRGGKVVQFFQNPTLTAAERDAVDAAILFMESRGVMGWAATLHGLLERTGGKR